MNKDDVLRFLMSALSSIQVADELIPELIALLAGTGSENSIFNLLLMRLSFCKISVQNLSNIRNLKQSAMACIACTSLEKDLISEFYILFCQIVVLSYSVRSTSEAANVRQIIRLIKGPHSPGWRDLRRNFKCLKV